MTKGRVIYEDEAEPHFRLAYPRPALAAFVEYYFEVNQPATLANPLYLNGLPNLSNLICISLTAQPWLTINQQSGAVKAVKGSRFFGNLTNLHTSIYPAGVHEFYVKFKPGTLGKLLRFRNVELENANADLAAFIRSDNWEDRLQTAPSFDARVKLVEMMLLRRTQAVELDYRFQIVQKTFDYFGKQHINRPPNLAWICRELGVSYPSLHRYFTEALGYSPKYCQKLIRFKNALQLYRRHGSRYPFEDAGYTDFSHFLKDTRQLTQRLPSEL
ncbi:helix-turn-helix domain-containing protein [Larkinella terrae]|uniref:Helix-turn-helix domain-containing protein n=1 Tax=Larkinella terrae TaxID=2025311 RepID=A0A7K0EGQ5_9BACT|nr:helix-turn-helix domain-containing protein [Larkinella terrae]MRS61030.1 helix-turn-helix domain-containing protein [Larkinella terrae]